MDGPRGETAPRQALLSEAKKDLLISGEVIVVFENMHSKCIYQNRRANRSLADRDHRGREVIREPLSITMKRRDLVRHLDGMVVGSYEKA